MPVSSRAETTASPRAHRPSFSRDSLEQIRRREVSRILKKIDPPPEEEEAIERFSRLLVAKLLLGPISEAMTRAETWASRRARDHEHLQSFEEAKVTLSRWSQGYLE